jgi:hypothetical protein
MLLRWLCNVLKPQRGQASLYAVVYVAGPMRLGFEVLGNSFGFGLVITLIDMITMMVLLCFVRQRRIASPGSRSYEAIPGKPRKVAA